MKRKLLIVFSVVIILALFITGSYAFFTREDTAENVISTGSVEFVIKETTDGDKPFPTEGIAVMPGDKKSKIVSAENTGKNSFYFRIKLIKGINKPELSAENQLKILGLDETNWTYKDGYYYYNEAVAPGEKTTPLFTGVEVDGLLVGNEYLGATFSLDVVGEAVQEQNNGTNVFNATGWPTGQDS